MGNWDISVDDFESWVEEQYDDADKKFVLFADQVEPGGVDYKELLITIPKSAGKWLHGHWPDHPNVVAHTRFNTRVDVKGNRILFVEEIQSDWHQEGRKKGYQDPKKMAQYKRAQDELLDMVEEDDYRAAYPDYWSRYQTDPMLVPADIREKMEEVEYLDRISRDVIPDAPFKKTWELLVMKRLVKYAADNGFDGIAWTSGEMQNQRNRLSTKVDSIKWVRQYSGTYRIIGKKDGTNVVSKDNIPADQLDEHVGKGLANKIKDEATDATTWVVKYPDGMTYNDYPTEAQAEAAVKDIESFDKKGRPTKGDFYIEELLAHESGAIHGKDLDIGGAQMKSFYDRTLVNVFNKFFNKETWGKAHAAADGIDLGQGSWGFMSKGNPMQETFETKEKAVEWLNWMRKEKAPWVKHYKPLLFETEPMTKLPGVMFTQEIKDRAPLESMPMFDLDIKSDTTPEVQAVLKEKFGREEKTIADRIKDTVQDFSDNWETRAFDRMHPIKEFLGQVAYMLHRGIPGVQSTFNALMAHGKLKWDTAGQSLTVDTRNQGFLKWIKGLGSDSEKTFYWIMAKRAETLEKEGREFWLTEDVRKVIFDWAGEPKGDRTWEQINEEFQEWNQNVLDVAIEAGLLNKDQIADWQRDYYLPFYRVFEDQEAKMEYVKGPAKGKIDLSARIMRLKGAEKKLGDPFENIIRNWSHLIGESVANRARLEAYEYAKANKLQAGVTIVNDEGDEVPLDLLEEVSAADTMIFRPAKGKLTFAQKKTGLEVLSFKKEGKTVFIKVNDPELFQALSLVNKSVLDNHIVRAMAGAKRVLTAGATFGPAFRVANMIRDTLHTFQITDGMTFVPFIDTAKGFVSAWREDQDFVEFMASGHAFGGSYTHAEDPKALQKYVKRIARKEKKSVKDVGATILDTPKKLYDLWEKIGSASENAARVQLYKNLKKGGKSNLEAAFTARDLMDFQMKGNSDVVSFLVATVPFLNARMQGLYRMGRAAVENPKVFFAKGAMITMATMALWYLNHDDERYKALEAWEKFTYYHFWIGKHHYRIPKPFETGVLFSTLFEAGADVAVKNEDGSHLMEAVSHAALETFAFNPIPQALRPAAEQWANKSFFSGRPIESQYQQGLVRGERYDPWTSPTLILAGKLGIPPKRAQALIRGYFADIGMSMLWGADLFTRAFVDFPVTPEKRVDQYPMIGRFVRQAAPKRNTKYFGKFWDTMNEIDQLVTTVNMYQRSGDFKGAQKMATANRKLLQARPHLNKARQKVREISFRVKQIWKHPTMDAEQKAAEIDSLYEKRNKYIKQIYDSYIKER